MWALALVIILVNSLNKLFCKYYKLECIYKIQKKVKRVLRELNMET